MGTMEVGDSLTGFKQYLTFLGSGLRIAA